MVVTTVTKVMAKEIANYIKNHKAENIYAYADDEKVYICDRGYVMIVLDRETVENALEINGTLELIPELAKCKDEMVKNLYEKSRRECEMYFEFDRNVYDVKKGMKFADIWTFNYCNSSDGRTASVNINSKLLKIAETVLNTKAKKNNTTWYVNTNPFKACLIKNDIGEALVMPCRI